MFLTLHFPICGPNPEVVLLFSSGFGSGVGLQKKAMELLPTEFEAEVEEITPVTVDVKPAAPAYGRPKVWYPY